MTLYVVDATNPTEPNDDRPASYLGIEMRTLKQHVIDVLTAQETANDSMQDAIAALEAINNTANGVSGLPALGSLAVLLSVYQELFGYTDAENVIHPSVAAKITALKTTIDNIASTGSSLESLVNQHTLSLNAHSTALQNINNTLNSINNTLSSHTNSINSINQSISGMVSAKLPIGFVLQTVNAANPNTYLGYGTWTQVSKGRIPVGMGDDTANEGYNITMVGVRHGERSIAIAKGNLPPHTHTYSKFTGKFTSQVYGGGAHPDSNYVAQLASVETGPITGNPTNTGTSAPAKLPIYPAMVAFYYWQRTA